MCVNHQAQQNSSYLFFKCVCLHVYACVYMYLCEYVSFFPLLYGYQGLNSDYQAYCWLASAFSWSTPILLIQDFSFRLAYLYRRKKNSKYGVKLNFLNPTKFVRLEKALYECSLGPILLLPSWSCVLGMGRTQVFALQQNGRLCMQFCM